MPYMDPMGNHLPFYLIPRMEDDLDDPIEEVHQNVREQNLRKLHRWNRDSKRKKNHEIPIGNL